MKITRKRTGRLRVGAALAVFCLLLTASGCLPGQTIGFPGGKTGDAPPQAVTLPEIRQEAPDPSERAANPAEGTDPVPVASSGSIDAGAEAEPMLYVVPETWKAKRPDTKAGREEAEVERVVDGDTLIVRLHGERERLRMLGIDAPESSSNPDEWKQTPEGDIVSDLVAELVTGRTVTLEFDSGRYDRFDRMLAYVWLDEDNMLNESLVYSGLVDVVRIEPNTAYYRYFKSLEKEADRLDLGFR